MPTKKYGVEVVVEGLSSFLSALAQINAATQKMGKAVSTAGGQVKILGATWNQATGQWRYANGKLTDTATLVGRLEKVMNTAANGNIRAQASMLKVNEALMAMASDTLQTNQAVAATPAAVTPAANAWSALSTTMNAGASTMGTLGAVARTALVGGINLAGGVVRTFGDIVLGAVRALGSFAARLASGAGSVVFGLYIARLIHSIGDLIDQTFKVTGEFQRLEIQFRTLAQRDIAAQFGIPVAQAFGQASQRAQELLAWVRKLAITTPYSTDDIAKSLALANAYGLTTKSAQVLTQATTDFASAMGLTSDHVYRIIYNFGQMQTQGKLTGREFRDLAVSFVPVYDIIRDMAKESGKTVDEMKKLALEGGVPVQQFFKSFVDMVNRDFKGSAAAMSKTITGVIDNLKDFFRLTVGLDILGPIGKTAAASLQKVLEALQTPEFQMTAKVIGGTLNVVLIFLWHTIRDNLLPALQELGAALGFSSQGADSFATGIARIGYGAQAAVKVIASVIRAIAKWISDTFGTLQKNGLTWGQGLIRSFAQGIAAGIKLVIMVIGQLAQIIANLFRTHSPPKIAPEMDAWGTGLMASYAQGMRGGIDSDIAQSWKDVAAANRAGAASAASSVGSAGSTIVNYMADAIVAVQPLIRKFGADVMAGILGPLSSGSLKLFNDLAETASSFLRSLSTRVISEEGIIPRVLGTREAIAQAIAGIRSGALSVAQAFATISAAMGEVPKGMREYVSSMIALEAAQTNLSAAQKLGNDVLTSNAELLSRMSGEVRAAGQAYVTALGAQTAAEAAAATAERNLAEAKKVSAAAQAQLSEITRRYDAVLKDLNAQLSAVTDQYDQQQQLEEIQRALASGLLTTAERERLEMQRKAILLKQQIAQVEAQRDAETAVAQAKVDSAKASEDAAQAAQTAASDAAAAARDEASQRQKYMLDLAQAQADAIQEQVDRSKALIDIQTEQNNLIQQQIDLLARLAEAGKGGGAGAAEPIDVGGFGDLGGDIISSILPDQAEINRRINEVMNNANQQFRNWKAEIKKSIAYAFGYDNWDQMAKDFDEKLAKPVNTAVTNFNTWWETDAKPLFDQFGAIVSGSFTEIGKAADTLSKSLKNVGIDIKPATLALGVFLAMFGGGIVIALSIASGILKGLAWAIERINIVTKAWAPQWEKMSKAIEIANKAFSDAQTGIQKFSAALGLVAAYVGVVLWGLVIGIGEGFSLLVNVVLGFVFGLVSGIWDFFVGLYNSLVGHSLIPDLVNGIIDYFSSMKSKVLEIIRGFIAETLAKWESFKTDVRVKAEQVWDGIKRVFDSAILDNLAKIGKFFLDLGLKFIGNISALAYSVGLWISGGFQAIWTAVTGLFKEDGAIGQLWSKIKQSFLDNTEPLRKAAELAFTAIRTAIESVINGVKGWLDQKLAEMGKALQNILDLAKQINLLNPKYPTTSKNQGEPDQTAATGLRDFTVPPGYPNDSFLLGLTSGERVSVFSVMAQRMGARVSAKVPAPAAPSITNNIRNVSINVNAAYANAESPLGIYWDISSALIASGL